jgi:hypothetical protein
VEKEAGLEELVNQAFPTTTLDGVYSPSNPGHGYVIWLIGFFFKKKEDKMQGI